MIVALQFVNYKNLIIANTLGNHRASRTWTWHAPNTRKRWTEYCQGLYSTKINGDAKVLEYQESSNFDDFPILKDEEMETAIKSLKDRKCAGNDNIPVEVIKYGGGGRISDPHPHCKM